MTDFLLMICGPATALVLALAAFRQGGVMRPQPIAVRITRHRR